jgi:hypothetical protein
MVIPRYEPWQRICFLHYGPLTEFGYVLWHIVWNQLRTRYKLHYMCIHEHLHMRMHPCGCVSVCIWPWILVHNWVLCIGQMRTYRFVLCKKPEQKYLLWVYFQDILNINFNSLRYLLLWSFRAMSHGNESAFCTMGHWQSLVMCYGI